MTVMIYVWLGAVVAFSILEAATSALVSVWFIGGAVAAFVTALLGGSILVQCIVFLAVSAILLAALRPLAKKRAAVKKVCTNADRILGQEAVVTEEIDNLHGRGAVKIAGVEWTARSEENTVVPKGATVRILRIDGVKVYVEKTDTPANL